jgi:hypothetical protein
MRCDSAEEDGERKSSRERREVKSGRGKGIEGEEEEGADEGGKKTHLDASRRCSHNFS